MDSQVICTFHLLCLIHISVSNLIVVIEYPENLRLLSVADDLKVTRTTTSKTMKKSLESLKERLHAGPLRNSFYASGNAVLPSLLNVLLCQTFFNEHLIDVVETLLQSNCISVKDQVKNSHASFSEAFLHYLQKKGKIVLGVIRHNDAAKNTCVLTLPPREFPLQLTDKLIVLHPCDM